MATINEHDDEGHNPPMPDAQTIFFVNFPLEDTADGEPEWRNEELYRRVGEMHSWSFRRCEGEVQQEIQAGKLPSDWNSGFPRSSYRAKRFAELAKTDRWFTPLYDGVIQKRLATQKSQFHQEIYNAVLDNGFTFSVPVMAPLENVLAQIRHAIKASTAAGFDKLRFCVVLTRYTRNGYKVQPTVRIIEYETSDEAKQFVANKDSIQNVQFDLLYRQWEADFSLDSFEEVSISTR